MKESQLFLEASGNFQGMFPTRFVPHNPDKRPCLLSISAKDAWTSFVSKWGWTKKRLLEYRAENGIVPL